MSAARPYGRLTGGMPGDERDVLARDLRHPCHRCGMPLKAGDQIADDGPLPHPRRLKRADGSRRPQPRRIAHAACVVDARTDAVRRATR